MTTFSVIKNFVLSVSIKVFPMTVRVIVDQYDKVYIYLNGAASPAICALLIFYQAEYFACAFFFYLK